MKILKNTSIFILLLLSACQKDCAVNSNSGASSGSDKTDKSNLSVVTKQKENKKQKQKTKKEVKLENSLAEENNIKPDSTTTIADEPDLGSLSNNEEQVEQERIAREEKERIAKEEQERKAREEKERIAREEKERIAKEEKERIAKEEKERKAREEQERIVKEEKINNIVDDLFKTALEKPSIENDRYGKTKSINIDLIKRELKSKLIDVDNNLYDFHISNFVDYNIEDSLKKAYKDYIGLDYFTQELIDKIKKAKLFAENLDNKEFLDKYNENKNNLSSKTEERSNLISPKGYENLFFTNIIAQKYKNKQTEQFFILQNKNNNSMRQTEIYGKKYYSFTDFLGNNNKTDYFDFTDNKQIKDELNDESIKVLTEYGLIKANQEVDDLVKAQSELMDTVKEKENFAEWKDHKDEDLAYCEEKLKEKEEKLQALKKVFSDIADKIKQKL